MKTRTQLIEDTLLSVGVRPNLSGFAGSVTVTRLWMEAQDNGVRCPKICTIYHDAAKELGSTASRVERAIRHAIEIIHDSCEFDDLSKVFNSPPSLRKGKYTNSDFVSMLALLVRREENIEGGDGRVYPAICPGYTSNSMF